MTASAERKMPIPAVAGVIIRNNEILLIRRGKEPSLDKWAIPGGHVEWGETLEDALCREVMEETSLKVEVEKLGGVFDLMTKSSKGTDYHFIIVDYFVHPIDDGDVAAGDDAVDTCWVPFDKLSEYELVPKLRDRLKKMGIG